MAIHCGSVVKDTALVNLKAAGWWSDSQVPQDRMNFLLLSLALANLEVLKLANAGK